MSNGDEVPSLTTRILVEIRDELRNTNAELRKTNERVDRLTDEVKKTNVRVDHLAERIDTIGRELPQLLVEMEGRLATTMQAWVNQLRVVDMAWRQGVEKRLGELEKKTG